MMPDPSLFQRYADLLLRGIDAPSGDRSKSAGVAS